MVYLIFGRLHKKSGERIALYIGPLKSIGEQESLHFSIHPHFTAVYRKVKREILKPLHICCDCGGSQLQRVNHG